MGGISYVVHSILKQQQKQHNLDIFFSFPGEKKIADEILKEIERIKISSISILSPINFFKSLNFILRNKNDFDVIHQHGVFLPISILSIIKSFSKTKIIISPHGLLEPDKLEVSKLKKKIVMFLYENLNLKRCSCLVACSVQEAKYLQQLNLKKPVVIIPNGVEDDFLNKAFPSKKSKIS